MSADLEYRKRVAYHEAGHTIQYLLACERRLTEASKRHHSQDVTTFDVIRRE